MRQHLHDKLFSETSPLKTLNHPQIWLAPLVALLIGVTVGLSDANQWLFLQINHGTLLSDGFWDVVTQFGDPVVAIALLLPLCRKRPELAYALLISAILCTLFVHSMKFFFEEPRPLAALGSEAVHVIGEKLKHNAFPSGHTATAFLMAGIGSLLVARLGYTVLFIGLALLIGISRIAVGAHWPLDVAAGAFIGWTSAVIGVLFAKRYSTSSRQLTTQRVFAIVCLACALALLFYPFWLLKLLAIVSIGLAIPDLRRLFNN